MNELTILEKENERIHQMKEICLEMENREDTRKVIAPKELIRRMVKQCRGVIENYQ